MASEPYEIAGKIAWYTNSGQLVLFDPKSPLVHLHNHNPLCITPDNVKASRMDLMDFENVTCLSLSADFSNCETRLGVDAVELLQKSSDLAINHLEGQCCIIAESKDTLTKAVAKCYEDIDTPRFGSNRHLERMLKSRRQRVSVNRKFKVWSRNRKLYMFESIYRHRVRRWRTWKGRLKKTQGIAETRTTHQPHKGQGRRVGNIVNTRVKDSLGRTIGGSTVRQPSIGGSNTARLPGAVGCNNMTLPELSGSNAHRQTGSSSYNALRFIRTNDNNTHSLYFIECRCRTLSVQEHRCNNTAMLRWTSDDTTRTGDDYTARLPGPSYSNTARLPGTSYSNTARLPGTSYSNTARLPGTSYSNTARLPWTSDDYTARLPGTSYNNTTRLPGTSSFSTTRLPWTSSFSIARLPGSSAHSSSLRFPATNSSMDFLPRASDCIMGRLFETGGITAKTVSAITKENKSFWRNDRSGNMPFRTHVSQDGNTPKDGHQKFVSYGNGNNPNLLFWVDPATCSQVKVLCPGFNPANNGQLSGDARGSFVDDQVSNIYDVKDGGLNKKRPISYVYQGDKSCDVYQGDKSCDVYQGDKSCDKSDKTLKTIAEPTKRAEETVQVWRGVNERIPVMVAELTEQDVFPSRDTGNQDTSMSISDAPRIPNDFPESAEQDEKHILTGLEFGDMTSSGASVSPNSTSVFRVDGYFGRVSKNVDPGSTRTAGIDAGTGRVRAGAGRVGRGAGRVGGDAGRVRAGAGRVGRGAGRVNGDAGRVRAGAGRVGGEAGRVGGGAGRVRAGAGRVGGDAGRVNTSADRVGAGFGGMGASASSAGLGVHQTCIDVGLRDILKSLSCMPVDPLCTRADTICTRADTICTRVDTICTRADTLCTRVDTTCARADTICTRAHTICTRADTMCTRVDTICARAHTICTRTDPMYTRANTICTRADTICTPSQPTRVHASQHASIISDIEADEVLSSIVACLQEIEHFK